MIKGYLVICYGILVKSGVWDLEPIEGGTKPLVPEEYRVQVADHLASQNKSAETPAV